MRISTLAVTAVSVVALLSTNKAVAADGKAGKPGRQDGIQRISASIKVGHDARSPQDSDGFVSYDYGYSYPAPPPPTTYAKLSSSSTWTSLASSSNVSYTETTSVTSVIGTSSVSDSASFSSVVSISATATLRDSVSTSLPTSVIATLSASTTISESLSYMTSFKTGSSTSSLDDESGTLASVTDTDVPYTPSTGSSDSTIWSHSTTSISSMLPSFTLSDSTAIFSSAMTFSKPDSASTSYKRFKHAASVHELIYHGASSDQFPYPPREFHHKSNGDLEYVRRTIFHFDKYFSVFHNVFTNGLVFPDDCAVSVAQRNCHCYA
ncbi:uncharacterized protein LY79DRAFT_649723 [Colletotrichum navitas]|uniref:Uncharacterized protein n=1 Tax=Colletotrichum navitas TaxID=681940 RepID=A0AAD8Q0X2_9PEZI|nr:uncharacterized protein LY79DRAFT_649723 [Colletotrichum navitas]KAK1590727.1 hypothetical protein LY79DRAFT_649723 [Colletotrichum navitas]